MDSSCPLSSDDCPELTPDSGTSSPPTPDLVNWTGVNRRREGDAGNSQFYQNALRIANNNPHQASPERADIPARVPPAEGSQYQRSPFPQPSDRHSNSAGGSAETVAIPPLELGAPMLKVPRDPSAPLYSDPVVDFEGRPIVIPPWPSTLTARPANVSAGTSSRVKDGFRWLKNVTRSVFRTRLRPENRNQIQSTTGRFMRRLRAKS